MQWVLLLLPKPHEYAMIYICKSTYLHHEINMILSLLQKKVEIDVRKKYRVHKVITKTVFKERTPRRTKNSKAFLGYKNDAKVF